MALKFKKYDTHIKCFAINKDFELDIKNDMFISLSVYINICMTITKWYFKTELRLQKIEELLEVLEWD